MSDKKLEARFIAPKVDVVFTTTLRKFWPIKRLFLLIKIRTIFVDKNSNHRLLELTVAANSSFIFLSSLFICSFWDRKTNKSQDMTVIRECREKYARIDNQLR